MPQPLISIVMPSYNQAQFIEASIMSILQQSYAEVEVIISDGGSTDGTVEILEHISANHPRLSWCSEKDSGPAHAINKAFSKVRGEIVGWLNSDDLFTSGAFEQIIEIFEHHADWIMCYGHGEHIDETGQVIARYPTLRPDVGLAGFRSGCYICQPTVFFKTSMLTLLGKLDTSLKTAFDYEYWLRAFQAFPERIGFVDAVLAQSRLHADCITNKMRATVALEGMELGLKYRGKAELHWATTYLEELRAETNDGQMEFEAQAKSFLRDASAFLVEEDMVKLNWVFQSGPSAEF
ncbi:MAG: glycosyltransferase family 2 protein [Henriciella sp.]